MEMDKQQNILLKSYFRTRNQATDTYMEEYEIYELESPFVRDNNIEINPKGYPNEYRAKLINQKIGEERYKTVTQFILANNTIGLGMKKDVKDTVEAVEYVDENGNKTIDGISEEHIKKLGESAFAGYLNQKYKTDMFTSISSPRTTVTDKFIKFAYTENGNAYIVNSKGDISVDEVRDNEHFRESYSSVYLNTKGFIDGFSYTKLYGANYVIARYKNGNIKLLNKYSGEPITELPDKEVDSMWRDEKAQYYNQIKNTKVFKEIAKFEDNNAWAKLIDGEEIIINRQGDKVDG